MKSLLKQIQSINQEPENGVVIENSDDNLADGLIIHMHVAEGIHRGASYDFKLVFVEGGDYLDGRSPPAVVPISAIFHPNMEEDNRICCNLLDEDWEPGTTLEAIIATIYCLLENPEFDNSLVDTCNSSDYEDEVQTRIASK